MGIRDAFSGFWSGLTRHAVPVVDAKNQPPTQASIPRSWSNAWMGPGQPMAGMVTTDNARAYGASKEPRTFEYTPNVNATISPRSAYGLLPFSELQTLAETVPDVAMCIRILTEELKAFTPRILDPDGVECKDPALKWMTTRPDGFNPWPVWLSRFLYNTLAYDAGALYRPRVGNKITALRVIDGSTLFALIDERGEQPAPPAPAFMQVIYGVPRNYFNTYQIWYRPRHLRADAPYGRTAIEDALEAVYLLRNLWSYEQSWYTEGSTPEQVLTAPEAWTPEQILAFEEGFNAKMAGNTEERAGRIRFLPGGTQSLALKDAGWRQDVYDAGANTVRMAFGIPRTEFGESPGSGLGGSGFLEAMQNNFYRMGIAPLRAYIESPFNDALDENGYRGYTMELAFPRESIDPQKEEERAINRFTQGLITRNEARQMVGLDEIPGPAGEYLVDVGPGQPVTDDAIPVSPRIGAGPGLASGSIPVTDKIMVRSGGPTIPVAGGKIPVGGGDDGTVTISQPIQVRKVAGVDVEDDAYFGLPVTVSGNTATISGGKMPDRQAIYLPGEGAAAEAVYLIDRQIAPDDQRYLVPVAWRQGDGLVMMPIDARVSSTLDYTPAMSEQAAVLDYIAGIERQTWYTHPTDPGRPVLDYGVGRFSNPKSPFIHQWSGKDLSADMRQSLDALVGDSVLWQDVAECVGEDAAQAARRRAVELQTTGRMV